jgi:serine/threonine protein kinase
MLENEAVLLGKLAGLVVPRLVDSGRDEHGPFVVTERVDAPTLAELGRRADGVEQVQRATRSAFRALATVHEAADARGALAIVHADLSPDNVLITEDRAVILDWSFACWRDAPCVPGGAFRGTPAYAAPEAARGEAIDARADLFALAASLLHAASGEAPRTSSEPASLLLEAGEASLDDYARRAGAALDPSVSAVLARCLAFASEGRPGSAREVGDALDAPARGPC